MMELHEIDCDCRECGAAMVRSAPPKLWVCPNGHGRLIGPAKKSDMNKKRREKRGAWIMALCEASPVANKKGKVLDVIISGVVTGFTVVSRRPTKAQVDAMEPPQRAVRIPTANGRWRAIIITPRLRPRKKANDDHEPTRVMQ